MWRSNASSKYYKRANAQMKRFERAFQEAPYPNPNSSNMPPASNELSLFQSHPNDQSTICQASVLVSQNSEDSSLDDNSETYADNLCVESQGGETSGETSDELNDISPNVTPPKF